MNREMWESLDEKSQRSVALLGRTADHLARQRACIPWLGNFWETFGERGQLDSYWALRDYAANQGMELIVRARKRKGATLTILGEDRAQMGALLQDVIDACERHCRGMDRVCASAKGCWQCRSQKNKFGDCWN